MSQLQAWSYSRLTSYETCPRRYYGISVAKTLVEEPSEAMQSGNDLHKAFELYLKRGTMLPLHLRHYGPILSKIAAAPGEKIVEQQIALNAKWEPVEWFAKDTWLRVKSDLTQLNGPAAICWDWKTGRPSQDFTQLRLNAAVTFHLAPEVNSISMAYLWTKTKLVDTKQILRSEVPAVWSEILPRVEKYQKAHQEMAFPARQNYFCKGCPDKSCPFWEKKK